MPTPPPTVAIEPSGRSTVLWWPRPTFIDGAGLHPEVVAASSKTSVVETARSVVVEAMVGGELPPRPMTRVEPPGPPGMRTAVPQSRSRGRFGASCQLNELAPGVFRNQLSPGKGPATSMRPLGIEKRCG
jgi:hypothetical protein